MAGETVGTMKPSNSKHDPTLNVNLSIPTPAALAVRFAKATGRRHSANVGQFLAASAVATMDSIHEPEFRREFQSEMKRRGWLGPVSDKVAGRAGQVHRWIAA